MNAWKELGHEIKLLIVIVASWIVPPLLWRMTWFDDQLISMVVFIAYIGFFVGISNLISAIKQTAHREGEQLQLRALEMDDLIKDKSDPAWEEYFRRNKFTAEQIDEMKNS